MTRTHRKPRSSRQAHCLSNGEKGTGIWIRNPSGKMTANSSILSPAEIASRSFSLVFTEQVSGSSGGCNVFPFYLQDSLRMKGAGIDISKVLPRKVRKISNRQGPNSNCMMLLHGLSMLWSSHRGSLNVARH